MSSFISRPSILIITGRAFNAWRARLPLALLLKKMNFDVTIMAHGDEYYTKKIEAFGVRFIDIPLYRHGIQLQAELICLVRIIKYLRLKENLICHAFNPKPIFLITLVSLLMPKLKFHVSITGLGDLSSNTLKIFFIKCAYRLACQKALTVCVENDAILEFLVENKIADQAKCKVMIASGVETKVYSKRIPDVQKNCVVFFFASRLLKSKGILDLLMASTMISKEFGSRVKIKIAGEFEPSHPSGVQRKIIETHVSDGIVEYLGNLTASDVINELEKSHVAILPSYREGMSKFLMEAAASGCASISYNIPGCREIISNNETGILVELRNSEELAAAMRFYLNNPIMATEHGLLAQKKAQETFDFSIVTPKYLDLYDQGAK